MMGAFGHMSKVAVFSKFLETLRASALLVSDFACPSSAGYREGAGDTSGRLGL
jgi:hypothetical protein